MMDISLSMEGYWVEGDEANIPEQSGIYVVYRCIHDLVNQQVDLKQVLYIGESDWVGNRISGHEKKREWKKHLNYGETLAYSFGASSPETRFQAEAALIYQHKPPVNTEYINNFPFNPTCISLNGKIRFLNPFFMVTGSVWPRVKMY